MPWQDYRCGEHLSQCFFVLAVDTIIPSIDENEHSILPAISMVRSVYGFCLLQNKSRDDLGVFFLSCYLDSSATVFHYGISLN